MRRFVLLASVFMACGGQQSLISDGGPKNALEVIPAVNVYCKQWEQSVYFDIGKAKWVKFEWCSKW